MSARMMLLGAGGALLLAALAMLAMELGEPPPAPSPAAQGEPSAPAARPAAAAPAPRQFVQETRGALAHIGAVDPTGGEDPILGPDGKPTRPYPRDPRYSVMPERMLPATVDIEMDERVPYKMKPSEFIARAYDRNRVYRTDPPEGPLPPMQVYTPTIDERKEFASTLYDTQDYLAALYQSTKLLKELPGSQDMLRVAVLAACQLDDVDTARQYAAQLDAEGRARAEAVCAERGIGL
jgi:hypothetical protein